MRLFFIFAALISGLLVLAYPFWKQRGVNAVITISLSAYLVLMALGIAFFDTLIPETIKLSSGGVEIGLKRLNDAKADALDEIRKEATSQKLAMGRMQDEITHQEAELQTVINEAKQVEERLRPRTLGEDQRKRLTSGLRSSPQGQVTVRSGSLGEQEYFASQLASAMRASPQWKDHVHHAAPGSWEGLTDAGDETAQFLSRTGGIAIVVNDVNHPPDAARELESALKGAGITKIRISACGCANPPKPSDIWLYVLERN